MVQDAIVRAGVNDSHSGNVMCGATSDQASSNNWIEFTCDPPVLARYVSVEIPGMAMLILCEVMVVTCDFSQTGRVSNIV